MSDLAQTEMVSRATMHHIVNGMERADLVRRNIDPDDARRQILSLTAKGRATIRAAHRERIAYLKRLSGGVSGADLATTARTLCRLRGNAGAQSA